MDQNEVREAICKKIEEAFIDAPYPGDDRIVDPINNYGEGFITALKLKGKTWKELWPISIYDGRFNLFRLGPEGFQYYLPAYIIASLRGEDRGEIIEFVIGNLTPHENEADNAEFMERMRLFSSEQKAVIKVFVNYYYEMESYKQPHEEQAKKFWDEY
ncbi:MAG: hypothetical protein GC179_15870 [Anaerolineaceae bacterium]|nr:hypothetical protein [Anaerolineaceae bacterium]